MSLAGIDKSGMITLKGVWNVDKLSCLVYCMSLWVQRSVCVCYKPRAVMDWPLHSWCSVRSPSVAGRTQETLTDEEEHRWKGRRRRSTAMIFLSAGFPTKVVHLVSDEWHTVCFTDGPSAESHTGSHIYLSHRCFVLCFVASKATAQLCWGITSRCSTKGRLCYPTESKQTAPPCIWGHSATVQLRRGFAHTVFVMVTFEVQKHIRHNTIGVLTVFRKSQKLTDNIK